MEPKHFNMLAIAAVVSLVAAGVVHGAYNNWSTEVMSGRKLLPSLDKTATKVGGIALQRGKTVLTLVRKDKGWVLQERGGYPVDQAKISQLLVDLASAEIVEPKTKVAERYALLELEDPAKDDAKSTLVRMSDAKGKAIAGVVLGKRKIGAFGQGKAGTYVRLPGDPQTWLTNANVRATVEIYDWVDPVFFRMDPSKVVSMKFELPGGPAVSVVADAAKKGDFKLAGLPDGLKVKDGLAVSNIVTSLKTLELLDVRKLEKPATGKDVTPAVLETATGMKLDIRLRKEKTDRWISIRVAAPGSNAEAAKAMQQKVDGWEFKVADWRVRQTFKEAAELFERIKPEPQPATKAPPETPTKEPDDGRTPVMPQLPK
ncbi:MAG TPA: DUF4340 domain-containing protein [Hyphomicrobiaceae bacterium]|nr:DUF4340 domain-containing protein [Hyphomicrobiaceae bacterium]